MSKNEPPTTSPESIRPVRPPPPQFPCTAGASTSRSAATSRRDYRKGNWTLEETLILIAAKKKLDEDRRLAPPSSASSGRGGGELLLRWKWVENYCCDRGCLRSQNQCNDKWDNLLRDYKKVREYERTRSSSHLLPPYWSLEKHERKDRGLPSNVTPELFHALNDVVQQRLEHQRRPPSSPPPPPAPTTAVPPPAPAPPAAAVSGSSDSSGAAGHGSDRHESSPSPSSSDQRKRKKKVRSSIVRGASVLARTLWRCEERREKRHREAMQMEERRLQIEQQRNEVNRQGVAAMVAAVNQLSGAIQSLVSPDRRPPAP